MLSSQVRRHALGVLTTSRRGSLFFSVPHLCSSLLRTEWVPKPSPAPHAPHFEGRSSCPISWRSKLRVVVAQLESVGSGA